MLLAILISAGGLLFWFCYGGLGINHDSITFSLYACGRTPACPFHTRIVPHRALSFLSRFFSRTFDIDISVNGKQHTLHTKLGMNRIIAGINFAALFGTSVVLGAMYGNSIASLFILSTFVRCLICWNHLTTDHCALFFSVLGTYFPPSSPQALTCFAIAGMAHERAPVIAAAWTMSPAPLVGLILPLILRLTMRRGELMPYEEPFMGSPSVQLKSTIKCLRRASIMELVAPLGAFWAGLDGSLATVLTLAVCYGQMALGNDKVRYFGWSIPALSPALSAYLRSASPVGVLSIVAAHSAGHMFSDRWQA